MLDGWGFCAYNAANSIICSQAPYSRMGRRKAKPVQVRCCRATVIEIECGEPRNRIS